MSGPVCGGDVVPVKAKAVSAGVSGSREMSAAAAAADSDIYLTVGARPSAKYRKTQCAGSGKTQPGNWIYSIISQNCGVVYTFFGI